MNELRRRWFLLMPAVFITYSLAYLDRANYGFGAAAGLARSLAITDARAAFLGSVFFLGYFLFQVPGSIYAQRKSASRLVFVALLGWGTLASLTGVIRNYWLLSIDRFLLGVSESLIVPSMLILLMHWFTRTERSRANAILVLGNPATVTWMSPVTGYLIKAVGWQMAFVLEGLPSIAWAFVWWIIARDRPREASWLSPAAVAQLESTLEGEQAELPRVPNFWAMLCVPAILLLCLQFFTWSIGVYSLVLWLPTMIRAGSARGIETIGLLNASPFLAGVLFMLGVSICADRSRSRKIYIGPFLLAAGAGLAISYLTAGTNFWVGYAALVVAGGAMYAPYGPFFALIPELLPGNVAGEAMAVINTCGALGGFAGTWLIGFLQAATGKPQLGYLAMAVSLVIAGGLSFLLPGPPSSARS